MLAALALILAASPDAAYAQLANVRGDAHEAVRALVQSMEEAQLPRSAEVLLVQLAKDGSPQVRAAARDELSRRALKDRATQSLLARVRVEGKLSPPVALSLAREHLERALQLSPVDQGSAFTGLETGPAVEQAAGEVAPQPLDKDLAAEMGAQPSPGDAKPAPAPQPVEDRSAESLRELDAARSLAAEVPAGDESEASAHEVAGLAALAENDDAAATREFVAVATAPLKKGDPAAEERREKAYLQLARLAYAMGNDAQATELYGRVSRNAPEWLDALFEASWSRFRTTEDELALGNLLTLQAPFFVNRFFPEASVLKALILYENCRYPDARKTLVEFEHRYSALHDGLSATLGSMPNPNAASEFLVRGPVALQGVPLPAREEVLRVEESPDIVASIQAAAQLAREIDSLDQKSFRTTSFVSVISPIDRDARLAYLDGAGRKLIYRLESERSQLRELLGQSLRISYEIAGREKEIAASPDGEFSAVVKNDRLPVADDEENWPFDGEYWRDELGNYRYQLGRKCKKPRAAAQTAKGPSQPSHLAADPH
ncbi:MAG TPA: hypothetical protein VGH20_05235 [Myxococcales bacterium]|jgi:hypothetical protein